MKPACRTRHDEQIGAMIRAAFGPQAVVVHRRFIATGHFNTSYDVADRRPRAPCRAGASPRRRPAAISLRAHHPVGRAAQLRAHPRRGRTDAEVLAQGLLVRRHRPALPRHKFIDAVSMNHASVPAGRAAATAARARAYMARLHAQTDAQFGWPLADGAFAGSGALE